MAQNGLASVVPERDVRSPNELPRQTLRNPVSHFGVPFSWSRSNHAGVLTTTICDVPGVPLPGRHQTDADRRSECGFSTQMLGVLTGLGHNAGLRCSSETTAWTGWHGKCISPC